MKEKQASDANKTIEDDDEFEVDEDAAALEPEKEGEEKKDEDAKTETAATEDGASQADKKND